MNHSLYLLNEKEITKSKSTYVSAIANIKSNRITQDYKNDIDTITTYKIYIQSIEKVIHLLQDVMRLTDQQNVDEASYNQDTEIKNSIHNKINIIDSIINEFTKLFSVIKDSDLENIYNHLFMKFSGIEIQLKLYFIKQDVKYAQNCLKLCEYLLKIFKTLEQQALSNESSEKTKTDYPQDYKNI
jgi:hypothetical protein